MSEQLMAPPLDLDLSTLDTSLPLLSDGIYDVRVDKVEVKETNDKQGRYVALDMVTTAPATSLKGDPLGAGVHVFDNINLVPTGKANWEMVLRNIASVIQGAGESCKYGEFAGNPVQYLQGRTLKIKVGNQPEGISKNGKPFKAKNTVLLYYKK